MQKAMLSHPPCFELNLLPQENTERGIRNLSPTVALRLTPAMAERLRRCPDRIIRAIPLKDVSK